MADSAAFSRILTAVEGACRSLPEGAAVVVACSGGPDSLALAAAVARCRHVTATAVVVDHGLQHGSPQVAAEAADQCRRLGVPAQVVRVHVGAAGGPEAAARTARYAALEERAGQLGAAAVLLGHTLDDQAETVLLGLARGAGSRSLAGMASRRGLLLRPLLAVSRADTTAACRALDLTPWHDPHNEDPSFTRVRVRRQVLPELTRALGPGVTQALARTAESCGEDAEALDLWAQRILERARQPAEDRIELDVAAIADEPAAVRHRVVLAAARLAGSPAGSLTRAHVLSLDALISRWRGQGAVALPGGVAGSRSCGTLVLTPRSSASGTNRRRTAHQE